MLAILISHIILTVSIILSKIISIEIEIFYQMNFILNEASCTLRYALLNV